MRIVLIWVAWCFLTLGYVWLAKWDMGRPASFVVAGGLVGIWVLIGRYFRDLYEMFGVLLDPCWVAVRRWVGLVAIKSGIRLSCVAKYLTGFGLRLRLATAPQKLRRV